MNPKPLPPSKLSQVRAAYERGDFKTALRIAAKFPQLGEQKVAIERGWMALTRPDFVREIGRKPDDDIAAGVAALAARYGFPPPKTGE